MPAHTITATAELAYKVKRRHDIIARCGKITDEIYVIDAKIEAGKVKADGPKAKEMARLEESRDLYEADVILLDAQIAALEIALATELADLTPAQVDTLLFSIWARLYAVGERIYQYRRDLGFTIFGVQDPTDRSRRRSYKLSAYQANDWLATLQGYEAEYEALVAEAEPLEAEYERRGRWVRYVLCGANNGHLHYRGCHTLRWDTQTLLVAQASGLDQSEVVGTFGTVACTKCFPDAPV